MHSQRPAPRQNPVGKLHGAQPLRCKDLEQNASDGCLALNKRHLGTFLAYVPAQIPFFIFFSDGTKSAFHPKHCLIGAIFVKNDTSIWSPAVSAGGQQPGGEEGCQDGRSPQASSPHEGVHSVETYESDVKQYVMPHRPPSRASLWTHCGMML